MAAEQWPSGPSEGYATWSTFTFLPGTVLTESGWRITLLLCIRLLLSLSRTLHSSTSRSTLSPWRRHGWGRPRARRSRCYPLSPNAAPSVFSPQGHGTRHRLTSSGPRQLPQRRLARATQASRFAGTWGTRGGYFHVRDSRTAARPLGAVTLGQRAARTCRRGHRPSSLRVSSPQRHQPAQQPCDVNEHKSHLFGSAARGTVLCWCAGACPDSAPVP